MYGSVEPAVAAASTSSSNAGYDDPKSSSASSPSAGGTATIASCSINLANTIVGAGMLGLPGAFGGTGWLVGLILIAISATFSAHGLTLLSKAAQRAGLPSSFYSVALAAVPRYTILIDLAVALKCFGVATGYLITISDSMVRALDHILVDDDNTFTSLLLSRHFWVFGALVTVLPFSFYKTLDELKKASALALVFVFMLVGGICAYAWGAADPCFEMDEETCKGEVVPTTNLSSTVSKLPIFIFSFTCHQNIFPIVNEIQFRNQKRIDTVIVASIGFALVLFSVVAFEGYRTFGSQVKGDILLNYPETGQVTFLRICIAFMLALHYPLQLDPSRRCITSLVKVAKEWWLNNEKLSPLEHNPNHFQRHQSSGIEMHSSNGDDEDKYSEISTIKPIGSQSSGGNIKDDDIALFYIITLSFLLLSFTIAMLVDDLGVILALVGATGSTLVSYVLPGLIYIKIHPFRDASMICAYVQLGVGLLIMPLALYFVITGKVKH